jgi:hypothetical protein
MLRFIIILLSVILFSSSTIIAKDSQEKNAVRNYFIMKIADLDVPTFDGPSEKGKKEFFHSFFKKKEQEKIIFGFQNINITCLFSTKNKKKCIMHIITGGELTRFLCVLDDEKKLRISKLNERALQ